MNLNKEEIIYKKVSELKLNPNNPRKNDDAVNTVVKSIEKYGFKNPLIIDENNIVWCGNTRLKASKKMGLKEVPCILADDLTEEQIREYALIDNKSNEIADWDMELLSDELSELDLSDFELDWGIVQDEAFDESNLDDDRVKENVIVSINCQNVDDYNSIKEQLQNLVDSIGATLWVKMQ